MDVLVTGATGYTGSGVADSLVAAGHRVSGLARSDGLARKLEERGIRAARGDITAPGACGRPLAGQTRSRTPRSSPTRGRGGRVYRGRGRGRRSLWDTGRTTAHNSGGGSRGTRRRA